VSLEPIGQLERIGGAVCLDFVNTVDPRYGPDSIDYLPDYQALLEWAVTAGLVERNQAERLHSIARHQPQVARGVYRRAIALRDAAFELFRGKPMVPKAQSLSTLNAELSRSPGRQLIAHDSRSFQAQWPETDVLDRILWPIADSAAELLSSGRLIRVRECEGESCGWLFLDTSKAGRRRWCSMSDCGNRAKAVRRRASSLTPTG
jgi:predicted RNA-binding Zn ribbon-like protein